MMASPIMPRFEYSNPPEHFREVFKQVCALAEKMDAALPDCPEKNAGLRKLLEAKDCFVRAIIYGE